MDMSLGEKLLSLRKEKGLSQEELAEKLEISRQSVSKWERGEAYPDTNNLIKLAKIYDVSLDDLINDEEDEDDGFVEPVYKNEVFYIVRNILSSLFVIGILITYLVMGFVNNSWHPNWILFLFIPVFVSIFDCIEKGKFQPFNIIFLVVAIYLIMGLEFSLWHPGWIIFFAIFIYYFIAEGIDRLLKK